MFTISCHWFISWAKWIQSTHLQPIPLRFISILSSHLRLSLPNILFPSGFQAKILYSFLTYLHFSVTFRNKLVLLRRRVVTPRPTPQLGDHHLSAVPDCLFSILEVASIFRGCLLHPRPEDSPWDSEKSSSKPHFPYLSRISLWIEICTTRIMTFSVTVDFLQASTYAWHYCACNEVCCYVTIFHACVKGTWQPALPCDSFANISVCCYL
jgi:hypothetical protein